MHDEEMVPDEENTISDDVDIEEAEGRLEDKLKATKDKLKQSEEARTALLEDTQRMRADFLNGKKRNEEQLIRDRERITERHIEQIIPLADSFEMAMRDPKWQEADATWRKGVEGIYAQLRNIIKGYGVEILEPLGQEFNPHEHEALVDSGSNSIIAEVFQNGYKIGATVIRPAKVSVGTGVKE